MCCSQTDLLNWKNSALQQKSDTSRPVRNADKRENRLRNKLSQNKEQTIDKVEKAEKAAASQCKNLITNLKKKATYHKTAGTQLKEKKNISMVERTGKNGRSQIPIKIRKLIIVLGTFKQLQRRMTTATLVTVETAAQWKLNGTDKVVKNLANDVFQYAIAKTRQETSKTKKAVLAEFAVINDERIQKEIKARKLRDDKKQKHTDSLRKVAPCMTLADVQLLEAGPSQFSREQQPRKS